MSNEYWWAAENPKDVVGKLEPFNNADQAWSTNPMYQIWQRNMYIYYSTIIKPNNWDTGLVFKGKQGELIEVMVPQAKSLVQQTVEIITKQKLAFKVLADSTAQSVIQTARIGNALAKQIVKNENVDLKYAEALEHEILTGMSFMYVKWRTDKGEQFGMDANGQMHWTGDVEITTPTVWDVLFDPTLPDPQKWEWVQVREIHNRWNLIAQHPEFTEQLKALPSVTNSYTGMSTSTNYSPSDEDQVFIYAAYHVPTPAMVAAGRKGRMIVYGNSETVIVDQDNIYGELPVYVSKPRGIPLSGYGDPFFSMLIATQEMLDVCVSTVSTNNATFGVQTIIAPRASAIQPEQILGMNFLYYTPENVPGGGKPEPLQLTQSSPESYKLADMMKSYLQDLSRINSALRGDPPSQVSSGTAIATLTATAIESVNASAKSSKIMLKRALLGAINCYRRLASVERPLLISGFGSQSSFTKFTGKDLDPIKFVELSEVNPLLASYPGRLQIADNLLHEGKITNTKGYFAILEGAPPEELYKNELSDEDLINRENESMLDGQAVRPLSTDDHPYHVMMHAAVLNDPRMRNDPAACKPFMDHILEHYELAKGTDPMLTAMVRTGKMPEMGMMPPPPGAGGGNPNEMQAKPETKPADPAKDVLQRTGS